MAKGKHAGARVILTVNRGEYAEWKALAEALGKPTATVMRDALSMLLPHVAGLTAGVEEFKEDPAKLDDYAARMFWSLVKEAAK